MSDSSFSAQYGTGGIIYNQISKGGTNTIHGLGTTTSANSALNAASYGFGSGKNPACPKTTISAGKPAAR